jgi:hypothetical protein
MRLRAELDSLLATTPKAERDQLMAEAEGCQNAVSCCGSVVFVD